MASGDAQRQADGGWQGSRLMQIMFSMGMEEALEEVHALTCRVACQDDTYFFGPASLLEREWPRLIDALAKCGRRMRPVSASAGCHCATPSAQQICPRSRAPALPSSRAKLEG